jgi:hypothetical protein
MTSSSASTTISSNNETSQTGTANSNGIATTTDATITRNKLSEEVKEMLLGLKREIEERTSSSDGSTKYIKFKDGDTKVLHFYPELTKKDRC